MDESRLAEKKEREAMRARIRRFDNEFISYGNSMQILVVGLFEVFAAIIMMMPYQLYLREPMMYFMLGVMMPYPAIFYLMPYLTFTENKKTHSVYEKIANTPISVRELRRVRTEYLFRFLIKTLPIGIVAQILGAVIASQGIRWGNLLYAFLVAGVWPFLVNYGFICRNTRRK